jgi:hypothetical protein
MYSQFHVTKKIHRQVVDVFAVEDEARFGSNFNFTCIPLCVVVLHLCCHCSFSCPKSICCHMSRRRMRTMAEMHVGCNS